MRKGVRGRGSDNTRLRAVLDWAPRVSLHEGMRRTYHWIAGDVQRARASAVLADLPTAEALRA